MYFISSNPQFQERDLGGVKKKLLIFFLNYKDSFQFFRSLWLDRRGMLVLKLTVAMSRPPKEDLVMSDAQERRPAHDVIMEMIHEAYRGLSYDNPSQREQFVVRIQTLCQVMTTMVIPEEERVHLTIRLDRLSNVPITGALASLVDKDIMTLMRRLMHE